MKWGFLCLLSAFCFFSFPVSAFSLESVQKKLNGIRSHEPSFSEVLDAGLRNERLDLASLSGWQKGIKKAAWFPTLSFGYDRVLRETDSLSVSDNISVSSDSVTIGPSETDLDETIFSGDVFRVRAIWSLDEIVFNKSTLSVSQEGREMSKSRLAFSDYLFKVYSKRRELLGQYFLKKGGAPGKGVILAEQIQALTEQLDALTGGVFSSRWWREQ